jgi:Raf kinase inhibitor-like YbhB/YbcL family protein
MNFLIIIMAIIIQQTTMQVTSTAFEEGKMIPREYTCEGRNVSPPLTITHVPDKTVSFALVMDDPDAPGGTFDHWIVYNIPVKSTVLRADTVPGVQGTNGRGNAKYTGPCPPKGIHHYHFKVYALDSKLNLKEGTSKDKLLEAMEGHILGSAELIGLYTNENEDVNKRE